MKKIWIVLCLVPWLCGLAPVTLAGQQQSNQSPVALPAASRSGKISLEEALATRRSVRDFSPAALTKEQVSQLLWAAQGITDEKGHRTAPSAHAMYLVQVYAVSNDGLFRYDPQHHALLPLNLPEAKTTLAKAVPQKAVAVAPLVLLICGEFGRAAGSGGEAQGARLVNLEAGHVAQNVLLQATALGLGAVPVGGLKPEDVQKAMALPPKHVPVYLVPIGHPAQKK
jgi:SagB-type dehydrogenase family enzyme